jgi:O-acetyl-ADP-ribose deacetylase (regulator of RNase III)
MTAREGGTLFQTIYKPYIHNPNLHIDKKEDPFTVTIVGFKDSVTSAQESFLSKLERKISVDKMKLFVLTQLKPGLCDTIRSECKIRVFGFQPGSSEIVLEGDEGAAYMQARAKFLEELKNVFVHKKKFSMSHNDLVAILHYVKVKSVKVVLCTIGPEGLPRVSQVDTPDQCAVKTTVCGLKETDVNTVVSVLGAGPTVVTIEGVSSSQYRSLSSSHAEFSCEVLKKEYGVCLQYKPEQGTVSLCGFIKKDLKDVERRFKAHMCEVAETVTPFRCSKEEESLLVRMLFDRETAQGTQLKEEIAEKHGTSLRKTKSSGGIELAGPQDAADRVAQLIRDRLLRNFQLESFEFQCSPVIVEDIKAKVMEVEQSGLVAVRMNNSPIKEDVHRRRNIKLTAFSLDTDAFTAACKQLQELKPATKFVNIRPEEKEVITPEFTHAFQKQLGVRIHGSKKNDLLMVVHGLCVESVHKAVSYLRKCNFEMTHTPNLTVMQILFLRERYFDEISHISAHCRIVLPSTPLDVGLVHVTIEGQCHEVDAAVQRIDSLLEGFECRSTNLHVGLYDFCSNSEWKLATKSAIESESNVVVVYSPSLADRHNLSTCDFSRRHTVVLIGGTNGEELRKAEGVLSECLELTRCHLEASERDKTDLQAAIKNKRLEKGTLVTIRFCDSLGIELITPIRFEDKMEVLKSKITHLLHLMEEERYEQEIELEPLICRIIERKHADSFKPKVSLRRKGTSDSLILTGKKANVDLALARMREVVAPHVKSNLHSTMLEVADDRILYSKEIKTFVKSLEKAHCVDITLPDRQAEENVVKWEIALPSHDCSPKCRLQIVHGILTRETTDAIVIANNQNLNLQDGLAGGVLRYRGHALDVNFGGVVCVSGGNPPSQKIIHAVCRKWTDGRHSETAILETAYYNSLETAVRNGCQSVAFSPIGAGVLNCPMEETARCAASALVNFLSKYPNSIPMIKFVVCDRQDVPDFEARLKGVPSLLQSQQSAKNPTTPSAAVRSVSSTGSVVQNVVSFLGYLFTKEIPADQQRDGAVRNDPLWSPRLGSVTDARETVKDTVCIVVNGCEEDVEVVESQIKAFLRNSQTFLGPLVDISLGKQGDSALNTFSDWNLSDKSVTLLNVPPKSEEFKRVLAKMRETMPSVHLSKLERVQNPWLWRKYAHQCDLIREKNQNNLRELELFHGTRGNKPELIYGSEAGFDMRFCEQGLWGKGNYFAANAMYSHNYSHHTSGGMQQMFLARVIVGETYYCTPDRSLKMPPQKPARSSSVFSVERYDSVTGVTNGTQVYIIYDNAMAYPLYLITYIS